MLNNLNFLHFKELLPLKTWDLVRICHFLPNQHQSFNLLFFVRILYNHKIVLETYSLVFRQLTREFNPYINYHPICLFQNHLNTNHYLWRVYLKALYLYVVYFPQNAISRVRLSSEKIIALFPISWNIFFLFFFYSFHPLKNNQLSPKL